MRVMHKHKVAWMAAALLSLSAMAPTMLAAAGEREGQAKPAAAVTHIATGTVVSVNDAALVVSHSVQGKPHEQTFVLGSGTTRTGTLTPGAKVTVHYRQEGKTMVATSVTAHAATAADKKP